MGFIDDFLSITVQYVDTCSCVKSPTDDYK